MMDSKDIKELAELMKEMGLTSLMYRNGDESVKLTRPSEGKPEAGAPTKDFAAEPQTEDRAPGNTITVKSPMVGVFYASPGADEEPYVEIGGTVRTGDVLCLIEAMKTMNEITAERDGVITEICAENKQVVEFNQPLFRIGAHL